MRPIFKWLLGVLLLFVFVAIPLFLRELTKVYVSHERNEATALLGIMISEATENGGKFPEKYEDLETLVQDKKILYKDDGFTPRWIYHPDLTTSDWDKVILESTSDSKFGKIKIHIGGNIEFSKE